MRILVTGGAGFQGSHLAEHLLHWGHEVTILNTFSQQALANIRPFAENVTVVWGSVTDPEIVEKTVRGQEVVFHLAARPHVDESIQHPSAYLDVNVMGAFHFLEAVRQEGCRLIHASSCEVYGWTGAGTVSETAELRPHSPYAASKVAADRFCFAYWKTYDVNLTIVRPCNVYGPRQKEGKHGAVIPIFVEQALAGKPLAVFGSGEQRREYMHVDDVVSAYSLVLQEQHLHGEVVNFGTGETPSIREIAEFIARRLGATVEHGPARPGEVPGFKLDSTKARQLGFVPRVQFWEGLERYIQWRETLKRM
jgi:dTDP-glucose 4,6-dehydratase